MTTTVPVPRTWVTDELVDAGIMNGSNGPKGCFDWLFNAPRCSVYQSSTTNMTNDTETTILFDAELFDWSVEAMHSTSSSTGRITIPSTGLYDVRAKVGFAADIDGYRQVSIRKNGVTVLDIARQAATPALSASVSIARRVQLVAGDYIEVIARHTAGATIATVSGAEWTSFEAMWVAS